MPTITIGRDPSNDIILNDKFVSRQHAKLTEMANGQIMLADLQSSNGTYVNDQRITEVILNPKDVIKCANVTVDWQGYFSQYKKESDSTHTTQQNFTPINKGTIRSQLIPPQPRSVLQQRISIGFIGTLLITVGFFGQWLSGWGDPASGIDILSNTSHYLDESRTADGPAIVRLLLIALIIFTSICLYLNIENKKDNLRLYHFSRLGIAISLILSWGIIDKSSKMIAHNAFKFLETNADFPMYSVKGWGFTLSIIGCILLLIENWLNKYVKNKTSKVSESTLKAL